MSRAIGTDMFGPEGDRLVALGLLDIYSHPLITAETAAAGKAAAREAAAGDAGPRETAVD